jgi:hypothetical protein
MEKEQKKKALEIQCLSVFGLLMQRPTRLADGFGHAQLPYSQALSPLPSQLHEACL